MAEPFAPTIIWSPQPGPQTALLQCPVFEVFYGGARGGGKTEASIGDWLQHSDQWGENAIGLFVRRTLTQLKEVIARTKVLFPKVGGKFNEQKSMWTMANGARLYFAHLERDSDAENYQGWNLTRLYVEEATNFPNPSPIMKLKACLRSGVGVPVGMRLTGNPGGPGHKWVKERYIDPAPEGYKVIRESEDIEVGGEMVHVELDRVFIPAKLTDNQMLLRSNPAYVLQLRSVGSEALVRAWLNGDWSIIDGVFFDCFSYSQHVLDRTWAAKIPAGAHCFRAMDWGSARPFCVGWYALSDGSWGLPEGALLKYREWYGASGPNKGLKMEVEGVAAGILQRETEDRLTLWNCVADGQIFARDGGPSIGERFAAAGVTWRRADKERLAGWQEVRNRLIGNEAGPGLFLLDCCEATIDQLQTCQHEDLNSEDLDTDAEDHALDELRYACMSRPRTERLIEKKPERLVLPPWSVTFNQVLKMNTERSKREKREWA